MTKTTILALALVALGGCSSAVPSADQPTSNAKDGIRVDLTMAASDPNAIRNPTRSLEAVRGSLGDCYKETLVPRPGVAGNVAFRLTVDSDGRVEKALVTSDAVLADPMFDKCVEKSLMKARFELPVERTTKVEGNLAFGAF